MEAPEEEAQLNKLVLAGDPSKVRIPESMRRSFNSNLLKPDRKLATRGEGYASGLDRAGSKGEPARQSRGSSDLS